MGKRQIVTLLRRIIVFRNAAGQRRDVDVPSKYATPKEWLLAQVRGDVGSLMAAACESAALTWDDMIEMWNG